MNTNEKKNLLIVFQLRKSEDIKLKGRNSANLDFACLPKTSLFGKLLDV